MTVGRGSHRTVEFSSSVSQPVWRLTVKRRRNQDVESPSRTGGSGQSPRVRVPNRYRPITMWRTGLETRRRTASVAVQLVFTDHVVVGRNKSPFRDIQDVEGGLRETCHSSESSEPEETSQVSVSNETLTLSVCSDDTTAWSLTSCQPPYAPQPYTKNAVAFLRRLLQGTQGQPLSLIHI